MSLHRRRASPRYAVEQPFVVTGSAEEGGEPLEGRLLNVSRGGLAFHCEVPPPIGRPLQLTLAPEAARDAPVAELRACAVATSPDERGGSVAHCTFLGPYPLE